MVNLIINSLTKFISRTKPNDPPDHFWMVDYMKHSLQVKVFGLVASAAQKGPHGLPPNWAQMSTR